MDLFEVRYKTAAISQLAKAAVNFLDVFIIHNGPERIIRYKTAIAGAEVFKHRQVSRRDLADDHQYAEQDADEERDYQIDRTKTKDDKNDRSTD